MQLYALFRLAFAPAADHKPLALPHKVTRRLIMQKACSHSQMELPHLVSLRFQALFHSPSGVLFTFPSRYSFTIGHRRVFSLTGWSPRVPTRFHVPDRTQEIRREVCHLSLTGLSPSLAGLSRRLLLDADFVTLRDHSGDPNRLLQHPRYNALKLSRRHGFGLFRFRSPLLTESIFFLFHRVIRCFNSPG